MAKESKKSIPPEDDLEGVDLSHEELEKISDHFNYYIGDRTCHICGGDEWSPLGSIYTPDIFDRVNNYHRPDFVVPMVSVVCNKCGAVTNFMSDAIGIPHRIKSSEGDK